MKRTAFAWPLLALPLLAAANPAPDLTGSASAFLRSLTDAERSNITWSFEDSERGDVHYAPFGLDGVRQDGLSPESQDLAEALLATALSRAGHERVWTVRNLERDVRAVEDRRIWGAATRWMRDPGRYLWAFFGDPEDGGAWGFRLEGHHLSLNVTSVPGAPPATTPLFLGAQPRVVPPGLPSAGVAALGEEERLARELYASLDAAQRAAATLPYEGDRGLMRGQVARIEAHEPVGVARSDLSVRQRELLDALVDRFADLWSAPIAKARRAEIERARRGLHFAFVETDDPPHAYYTRISGPGLLIEIDNTTDGDHVHAVWHRPGADFGDDLLARHLRLAH